MTNNNWLAERMDELIRAVDEIFVGKIPSEDDLYGIHQVLVERRDAEIVRQSTTDEAVQRAIAMNEEELKAMTVCYEARKSVYEKYKDDVCPNADGIKKDMEWYESRINKCRMSIDALRQYQFPLAIQWTGKNLREVIDLVGLNPSANKWTWEEYAQVVAEKGLKIFTPDGPVMAEIGDWIIQNGKDCYVTHQYQKPTDDAVQRAIGWQEAEKESAQNDWERAGAEWRMEPGAQAQHDERMAAFDLAIQALRQMRSEPCWHCKGIEAHSIKLVKTVMDEFGCELGAYDTPYNFCPACGRKLKENER